MNEICSKNSCTGCSACANSCVHKAIRMTEVPPHGYLYPAINSDLCIDCGLCRRVCPVNNPVPFHKPLTAFAAISSDREDLMTSSSGGASSVLAHRIIDDGGVVYGSVEIDYTNITHQRLDNVEELYKIKGSKYVHSYTTECYPQIKADLKSGLQVLFLGTPCQVAGLINYLRKPYGNLTAVDLCCHGVPSQKFLRDDVEAFCDRNAQVLRNKGDMTKPWDRWGLYVTFRNKGDMTKPWDRYNLTLSKKKQEMIASPFLKDNYITAFMSGHLFRENCYCCPYAKTERVSDITIADFWGYKGKKIKTDDGISLLLPSTMKGLQLIESCKEALLYEERNVSEAINGNGQFIHPSIRPAERDSFLNTYPIDMQQAYDIAIKGYVDTYRKRILKDKIKRMLHPIVKLINQIKKR